MAKRQTLKNQLGEVTFRKKLSEQHIGEKSHFAGQPDKDTILKEFHKRIKVTKKDFQRLQTKNVSLSPFLEIGAEKCQRAMYLVNELKLEGFAGDLSLESLQSADEFLTPLGFTKMPQRLCLDAYHLPFRDNSIPFIFYYETLHHFPDPKPVLDEAYRVLRSDGTLFFNDEPIRQLLNVRLFRRDYYLTWIEKLLKYTLLLPFLSTIGKSEVSYGILEESFWLDIWEKSITSYNTAEVEVKPFFLGKSERVKKSTKTRWLSPSLFMRFLLAVQGGGITLFATVKKNKNRDVFAKDFLELLACPSCPTKPNLESYTKGFLCPECQARYTIKNDVFMLLPKKLEQKLYDQT